jgi:hypothetical protein
MTHTKTAYAAPQIRQHGALEAVTQGQSTGGETDFAFPANTPFADLTFS